MKLPIMLVLTLAGRGLPLQAQASLAAASLYIPPACSVAPYSDVGTGDSACPWIQQLKADQVTTGCGPGAFCPDEPVTREQMAILLERAMRGTATWDPANAIFKRILIVSPVNGNNLASGQRLLVVIASITDSSSNKHYLVLIEPGTYDLDDQQIIMPPYVTLLGSGKERTSIHTHRNGPAILTGDETVIDSLTVRNLGAGSTVHGIEVPAGVFGTNVRNVFASASGGTTCVGMRCNASCTIEDSQLRGSGVGQNKGVRISGDANVQALLRRVTAQAINGSSAEGMYFSGGARVTVEGGLAEASSGDSNHALYVHSGSQVVVRDLTTHAVSSSVASISIGALLQGGFLTVENSRLEADVFAGVLYGLRCLDGEVSVHNSRLMGASATVTLESECVVDIAGSQLAGGAVDNNGGTVRCALNYSENLNAPALTGCF